ncbi:MAG: FtsW/RodA/SpoVE family cell cycle protein [Clostridium sp.]|nr:FtsW/RodA/SpoVE family cell cycle protein [Clostridium sp.]
METYLQYFEYFMEFSRYAITLCMAFYTYECFAVFRLPNETARKGVYLRQNLCSFLIQLFCFLDLLLASKKREYFFFYLFVQIFLFSAISMVRMIYERMNRLLLNNLSFLLGIGFCVISRISLERAVRQYVIALVSLVVAAFVPYLLERLRFWKKITWLYAAAGIFLLGGVLILGQMTNGSKISVRLGGISFQPAEFVKLIFIFFLAAALREKISLPRVALTAALAGVHVLLLVVSKDLGSALIFFVSFVLVVFIATKNCWYLLAGAVGGSLSAWGAYSLFAHVRVRILAWKNPWEYIDNQGYQITQSLFAISSGGFFGAGLYQGDPKAIPYVDADFIFSAVCEELGLFFGISLIFVCVSCFVMMMSISARLEDRFFQLTVYGLGVLYIFQIFLTIGGGIKFIPLTGVTLPFVSYGGSSVMSTMVLFFIVQGSYRKMQQEGAELVRKRKQKTSSGGKRQLTAQPQPSAASGEAGSFKEPDASQET